MAAKSLMSVRNTVVFTTSSSPLPSLFKQRGGVLDRLGDLRGDAALDERAVSEPELARADQPLPGADDRRVGTDGACHLEARSGSAERRAATAGSCRVRVDDMEAGFLQAVAVLERCTLDELRALGVHHHTHGPERAHDVVVGQLRSRRTSRSCIPSSRQAARPRVARGCRRLLARAESVTLATAASVRVTGLGR